MNEQIVRATPLMWGLAGASVVVFVAGFVTLLSGRRRTGKFSWAGFVLIMFLAVLLYDLGSGLLTAGGFSSFLLSVFRSLQTMTANRDFELPEIVGVSHAQLGFLAAYGTLLFIVAPVSIVTAALEYFSGMVSEMVLCIKSFFVDSFVFSQLDERTIDLARDICDTYRGRGKSGFLRPCIVFANCGEADDDLKAEAHRIGAYCQDGNVGNVSRGCSSRTNCSIVLMEDDEVSAISTARQLKETTQERRTLFGGDTRIFVLTDFRDTEPLLFPEVLEEENDSEGNNSGHRGKVLVRGVDLSRELVEQIIIRYPLFLLSKPLPGVNVPAEGGSADGERVIPSTCWYQTNERSVARSRQRELYERPDRHILVLGAGSVGTEFLSYALWASRMDGLHTRIDVVDSAEDPIRPGHSLAEARFAAEAPEIMSHCARVAELEAVNSDGEELYDLDFFLVDVETDAFASFLAERAMTVSYVFVALGDDLLNARVAMHTRQILERELARNAASRDEFVNASRPIILAVIRNDEFAATVQKAAREGNSYDIICVGNNSDTLTYNILETAVGNRDTEYQRRSSRASKTHVKYRLFSFARNLLINHYDLRAAFACRPTDDVFRIVRDTLDVRASDQAFERLQETFDRPLDDDALLDILEQVDWTTDIYDFIFNAEKGCYEYQVKAFVKNWVLALMFQLYCTNGVTCALETMKGREEHSREWLLRMEHDRWNAYMRVQGVETADYSTVEHVFATGQDGKEKHRSNFIGLHPCLVSFDELALLEPQIYSLYKAYYKAMDELGISEKRNTNVNDGSWARLSDDRYIGIKRPQYGKKK